MFIHCAVLMSVYVCTHACVYVCITFVTNQEVTGPYAIVLQSESQKGIRIYSEASSDAAAKEQV